VELPYDTWRPGKTLTLPRLGVPRPNWGLGWVGFGRSGLGG